MEKSPDQRCVAEEFDGSQLVSFLWPSKLNPTPGVLTRFGRVLHWIATLLAACLLVLIVMSTHYYLTDSFFMRDGSGVTYAVQNAVTYGVVALLIYFAGRALRYILSGE